MLKLGIGIPAFVILVCFGTGLGHLLPVLDWFLHRQLFSFQCRTNWVQLSPVIQHSKKIVRK
jgi:hypothetical protein